MFRAQVTQWAQSQTTAEMLLFTTLLWTQSTATPPQSPSQKQQLKPLQNSTIKQIFQNNKNGRKNFAFCRFHILNYVLCNKSVSNHLWTTKLYLFTNLNLAVRPLTTNFLNLYFIVKILIYQIFIVGYRTKATPKRQNTSV